MTLNKGGAVQLEWHTGLQNQGESQESSNLSTSANVRNKMKNKQENIFDTTTKIRIIKEEIAYARSQLQPHDTGHIHTAISWMKERVKDLKKKPNLGD